MQPQRQNTGGFNASPVNPLPRVVIALFAVVMGIEALFSLGAQGIIGGPQAIGWRLGAIQGYAFSAEIFQWMLANGRWPTEHLARFVTYPFIHGNFTHALFAGVMLLALGKFVGEVFRGWAVLAVFFGASIGGAAIYGLLAASPIPLLGAFPGVYGLIGAFTYLLWLRLGQEGGPQIRAFTLIAFLMRSARGYLRQEEAESARLPAGSFGGPWPGACPRGEARDAICGSDGCGAATGPGPGRA